MADLTGSLTAVRRRLQHISAQRHHACLREGLTGDERPKPPVSVKAVRTSMLPRSHRNHLLPLTQISGSGMAASRNRVVAFALDVAVVSRAFPLAVGLADRSVQIVDQLLERAALADRIGPPTRHVHQRREIAVLGQIVGLETPNSLMEAAASTARPPTTWRITGSMLNRSGSFTSS